MIATHRHFCQLCETEFDCPFGATCRAPQFIYGTIIEGGKAVANCATNHRKPQRTPESEIE